MVDVANANASMRTPSHVVCVKVFLSVRYSNVIFQKIANISPPMSSRSSRRPWEDKGYNTVLLLFANRQCKILSSTGARR